MNDAFGQPIDCLLSAAWVEGEQPCLILQCQDIREQKRVERLKSEFVATVSHELRTPLTAIAGALGLVVNGALGEVPASMAEMLRIAEQNSQRLTLLINDLLDMEKLEAGKMVFDLQRCSLTRQLRDALSSLQSYAAPLGVELHLQSGPEVSVKVDPLRLQQVLANLLSNAVKFSPRGGQVTLDWQVTDDLVRVSVHDQGPGISDAFRPQIFGKFAQADATTTRQQGGTGLGLAICRRLIEHMHGRIGFDSSPGQGSTFWFELACQPQAATEDIHDA
ncbi:MAG: HAMP domain-containing histidine kinase [Aquabacterium sp.]|nr:MAG: HAMP domain-containing histidine kinase [Aquabacterium sp.]